MLRHKALLPLLSALVVGTIGNAGPAEAATKPVINAYVAIVGAPSHVATGGTLAFSMTFVQRSAYRVQLFGLDFEVWKACLCGPDQIDGTRATYRNPATGAWTSTPPASGNAYLLDLGAGVTLAPGSKISIPVRLPVTHLSSGTYVLADNGTILGNAYGSNDEPISYTPDYHEADNLRFVVGTQSSRPPATPAPTHHATPTGPPGTRPAATVTHRPSPITAPTTTGLATTTPSAAASSSTPPVDAAAPVTSIDPVAAASHNETPSWSGALPWLAGVLCFAALGVYVLLRSRFPRERDPSGSNSPPRPGTAPIP